jgi:hypothetical protein
MKMNDLTNAFLMEARALALTPDEHRATERALVAAMKGNTHAKMTLTEFAGAARGLTLTDLEKADVFARIHEHIQAHPLSNEGRSISSLLYGFFFDRLPAASVLAAVIVLTAGGTFSYAAESAVPGDILYPIKTHVNEPIIGRLKHQTEWQVEKVERRLWEVERLAEQHRLRSENRAALELRIQEHLSVLEDRLGLAEPDDEASIQAHSRLESMLERHEQLLSDITEAVEEKTEQNIQSVEDILQSIKKTRREVLDRYEVHQEQRSLRDKVRDRAQDRLKEDDGMTEEESQEPVIEEREENTDDLQSETDDLQSEIEEQVEDIQEEVDRQMDEVMENFPNDQQDE